MVTTISNSHFVILRGSSFKRGSPYRTFSFLNSHLVSIAISCTLTRSAFNFPKIRSNSLYIREITGEFVYLTQEYVHHSRFELILLLPFSAGTMMAEDLGVEAKEAAVREVAKLLPLPDLLQSISSIKADYISRQQVSVLFDLIQYIV